MKLALYSGGDNVVNEKIDKELVKLLPANPSITYIPAVSGKHEYYFPIFQNYFAKYGITKTNFFLADKPFSEAQLNELLSSDAIYLSGGNTYSFLNTLKQKGLIPKIREFVNNDGVLIGVSAGSLLQTPNINLAALPSFDCDENTVGLEDLDAIGLVDFEFFPHYPNTQDYDNEIFEYSKSNGRPIYACPEGSGIIVKDDKPTFHGQVYKFEHGKKDII